MDPVSVRGVNQDPVFRYYRTGMDSRGNFPTLGAIAQKSARDKQYKIVGLLVSGHDLKKGAR